MKITCVLTSYNRPNWVRHALKSIADQTHRDFHLVVVDESTIFDVRDAVRPFHFQDAEIHHFNVSQEERMSKNRLSINMNFGISRAKGDLLCFLCDDDYYFPGWFSAASKFFEETPRVQAAFGKLVYSSSREMSFPTDGDIRFFENQVLDPFYKLDHNQVVHRKMDPRITWPEDIGTLCAPDAHYFSAVATRGGAFHPIREFAAVKRKHAKCLQDAGRIVIGSLEGSRE